ncbi:hypothetical protein TRVL_03676 [Trypanosoma vivax]|nr:hypothetical protein TRVL_03676 [Trypanosoma vivax]
MRRSSTRGCALLRKGFDLPPKWSKSPVVVSRVLTQTPWSLQNVMVCESPGWRTAAIPILLRIGAMHAKRLSAKRGSRARSWREAGKKDVEADHGKRSVYFCLEEENEDTVAHMGKCRRKT